MEYNKIKLVHMKYLLNKISKIRVSQFAKIGGSIPIIEQQEPSNEFENFIMGMTNYYHQEQEV